MSIAESAPGESALSERPASVRATMAIARIVVAALLASLLPAVSAVASALSGAPEPRGAFSEDRVWERAAEGALAAGAGARTIVPQKYETFRLDRDALRLLLDQTPREGAARPPAPPTVLTVPMPDGAFARFAIQDSPILEAPLAAAFPEIRTFSGQGIDDPTASARFDWTPAGFHGIVFGRDGEVYIDPLRRGATTSYQSYYRRDYVRAGEIPRCLGPPLEAAEDRWSPAPRATGDSLAALASTGPTLRTYRLALAATGEYTQFQGGTVSAALSAMTTTVNRVTGIYEKDFAIRLVMVANETSIIYTNPNTDPYSNSDPTSLLGQNQSNLDAVIGSANYDIGHVVGTGGGGVAALGVVCRAGSKAEGETGSGTPIGDAFDVDYVAHEMGHQFGANHTFNGTVANCGGGNRSAGAAYEPGSGSTIMAYAGICASEDLQPHSDPYFHTKSYDEITAYVFAEHVPAPVVT